MANPDRASGFRPVGTLSGAPWQGMVRRGVMGSGDGTDLWDDIYIGDPVKFDAVIAAGNSAVDTLIPAISGATDVVGVCVGVGYVSANAENEAGIFNPNDLTKRYGSAADVTTLVPQVYIYYVPTSDVIFEIQSASDLDLTIGSQCDHTLVGSGTHGSIVTSQSSVELTTDSNTDVMIVAIPEYPDNDSTLANARYHVVFADRAFNAATPDHA